MWRSVALVVLLTTSAASAQQGLPDSIPASELPPTSFHNQADRADAATRATMYADAAMRAAKRLYDAGAMTAHAYRMAKKAIRTNIGEPSPMSDPGYWNGLIRDLMARTDLTARTKNRRVRLLRAQKAYFTGAAANGLSSSGECGCGGDPNDDG